MDTRRLIGSLGEMLQYPTPDLLDRASEWIASAGCAPQEARDSVARFLAFVESTPPGRLEEIYSASFDLSPACCPYVGHLLLGDNTRRSALILMLKQAYREAGLEPGEELPDHLSLMLRYLAITRDGDVQSDLIARLLLPALEKMVPALAEGNGYRALLQGTMALCRAMLTGDLQHV